MLHSDTLFVPTYLLSIVIDFNPHPITSEKRPQKRTKNRTNLQDNKKGDRHIRK